MSVQPTEATHAHLFDRLKGLVEKWRQAGYPCEDYPLIGEILSYQKEGVEGAEHLRYLREPQFYALEVYWYVRLVLGTPKIIDLYKRCYGDDKRALFAALGIPLSSDAIKYASIDEVLKQATHDKEFVREKRIEALNESLNLDYPSYIFALAMGAGKTVLIGTIIATEFAMGLRYAGDKFMRNALVFAPGTTIIESLRELSEMPYESILPPALLREFLANLKIEFPGKGKNIQALRGSRYNLIVTNTEKIALRANRDHKNVDERKLVEDERKLVEANLRLQKIASLPDLGVFSDEAHHTYGNVFDRIKRVRESINYIHQNTPLVAVVNTTGTPYHNQKPIKDVVVWYGLGDGIRDNILKEVTNRMSVYDMRKANAEAAVIKNIIDEFFKDYGKVRLPNGAKAKIAFYFRSQAHLDASLTHIKKAMVKRGEDISQILVNTQKSKKPEKDEFQRLNNPTSQKRVILLVGIGVEGWNCPSLFACALIKQQTSPTYVLQASTRCLRQTPGNTHRARVFLDHHNREVLDKQLRSNFGTDLHWLEDEHREKETVVLKIRKPDTLPELEMTRVIKRAVRDEGKIPKDIALTKPKLQQKPLAVRRTEYTYTPDDPVATLKSIGASTRIEDIAYSVDCHTAAYRIATKYHLPIMPILKKIQALYPKHEVPTEALDALYLQVEKQQANYKNIEETVTEVMALIKVKDDAGNDIFEKDSEGVFIHRLRFIRTNYKQREQWGLFAHQERYDDPRDISFHYTPYNFDSKPERHFFTEMIARLGVDSGDVEALLFTGGLTDPQKTDFHFEYMGEDDRYHRYYPDFVLVKKTGEFYIVEIKAKNERGSKATEAKRKAVEKLQKIQPDKFKYKIVYTPSDFVSMEEIDTVANWSKK